MSLRYLVDTNILSYFGCRRMPESRRRAALERFLDEVVLPSFPVLAYDREAADWHASEQIRLGPAVTPPFVDGQIAAIAMVNGLTLVTDNVVDFRCFEGLRLENWVERAPTP